MELTIPESVQTIKGDAFNGFFGNGKKVILQSVTPIGLSQSIGLDRAFVYVPKGSADAYRKASIWSESLIVEIDADPVNVALEAAGSLGAKLEELNLPAYGVSDLTISGPMNAEDFKVIRQMSVLRKIDLSGATLEDNQLPEQAFQPTGEYGSSALEEVILPNTVKAIGDEAFQHLSMLRTVNMPEDLENIGRYAFAYTPISSIDFSNTSLNSIGYDAFGGCPITGDLLFPLLCERLDRALFLPLRFLQSN